MTLDVSPTAIFRSQLVALGLSTLLLGAACSDTASGTAEPPSPASGAMSPSNGSSPASAPADPVGQATPNTESVASGPTPLDDTSAAEGAPNAAAADDAGLASDPSASDAGTPIPGEGDAGAPPVTDPNVDENLVFIQQDGFQTTFFALDCRSIGDDGTIVEATTDGATLPVGGGFTLECTLERFPLRATTDVLSASDEPWCAVGELDVYAPGGDDRLTVTIATEPGVSPAILIGTREGEPIELEQATLFGGRLWPLWIDAHYDVNEVARAESGKLCDEVFGL
ncbi:MAG TPA: hypothetical protein VMG12_39450 [Polyangiaceae bacterium]|nr:hypothetical protein [Polyangiaceae bacterium]